MCSVFGADGVWGVFGMLWCSALLLLAVLVMSLLSLICYSLLCVMASLFEV